MSKLKVRTLEDEYAKQRDEAWWILAKYAIDHDLDYDRFIANASEDYSNPYRASLYNPYIAPEVDLARVEPHFKANQQIIDILTSSGDAQLAYDTIEGNHATGGTLFKIRVPESMGLRDAIKWVSESGYATAGSGLSPYLFGGYYHFPQGGPRTGDYYEKVLPNGVKLEYSKPK